MKLPLRTERLALRLYEPEDRDALLGYYCEAETARYLPEEPWTEEAADDHLSRRLTRTGLDSPARALALVIELEGLPIGDVALWLVDETGARAEIAWARAPTAAGRGYATEAVRAVLGLAFGHYRLNRVFAQLDPRNALSARVCDRVGLTKEAHLRLDWWSNGEWTDNAIYGMLAPEWPARQSE